MAVSNRRGLGRLLELARRRGTRLVIAPEVMRELERAGIRVPDGFEEASLVDEDEDLIERLLRRTLGKDAVDRWKRRKRVHGLGEVQSIALAERLHAALLTDDTKARRVAQAVLGRGRAFSLAEFLALLDT